MDSTVLLIVLGAAFLHAFWNFLVKSNGDKALAVLAIGLGHIPLGVIGLGFSGLPPLSSAGYLCLSALLHTGYQIFLMHTYRFGELSAVYPIARGLSPLLLTVMTLLFGHDTLSAAEIVGVCLIGLSLFIFGFSEFKFSKNGLAGVGFAVITGLFIASYSLVDGLGTRHAGSAIAFYGVLSVLSGVLLSGYFFIFHRHTFALLPTEGRNIFLIGGSASYVAYAAVLWACLYAPIAVVSSLRETSSLFAVILGIVLLNERFTLAKIFAACTVIAGIALTRLG